MVARTPMIKVNPADLTSYAVAKESWITDGRGASALVLPAEEGKEPVMVQLLPSQAEYLISSGQVAPIPGVTRGYPADAVTGEAIELNHEERSRIESLPPLDPNGDNTSVEGQGFSSSDLKAPADDPGVSDETSTSVVLGNTSGEEAAQQDGAQDALASGSTPDPVGGRSSRRSR